MNAYYKTEAEILAVVKGFEKCTTGKDDFSHISHLTVATYYLCRSNPSESFEKMRLALLRFLDYHSTDRTHYKEQLTRDWIALIRQVVEQMEPETTLVDVTNEVIQRFGEFRIPEPGNEESL